MGVRASSYAVGLTLSATVMVAGCYPMEQAPLVYSSKHQVGVSVSAGTAEAPGLDLSLGYKGQDIAMVPVAVAKFCETARQADCTREIYRMQVIAGGRQEPLDNRDLLNRIENLTNSVKANELKRSNNAKAIADIETKLNRYDTLTGLRAQVAELTNAIPRTADVAEAATLSGEKAAKEKEIAAFSDVATLDADKARAERARYVSLNTDLDSAIHRESSEASRLMAQLNTGVAGRRDDALSVYGTFSGQAEGRSTEAKLSAGKVFATGVAAQYLAETAGTANCLAAITVLASKVTDNTERNKLVALAPAICIPKHLKG